MNLRTLQLECDAWRQRNFPNYTADHQLFGMVEELGELAHAHLKQQQGIRGEDKLHEHNAQDAIGDLIIFLTGYCSARGWDLQKIVQETWDEVNKRDWIKNPLHGGQ